MRKKGKNWVSAGDALKSVAKRIGISKKMRRFEVWNLWNKIAGPVIAAHARPARWQGNTLVVGVEHASWMQELSYLKPEILNNMRDAIRGIDVLDIRFEVGKIGEEAKVLTPPAEVPPLPLSPDEKEFIEQAAKEIKNDDARDALRRLMTRDFQQKKRAR